MQDSFFHSSVKQFANLKSASEILSGEDKLMKELLYIRFPGTQYFRRKFLHKFGVKILLFLSKRVKCLWKILVIFILYFVHEIFFHFYHFDVNKRINFDFTVTIIVYVHF